jgi:hypothetical protein
MNLSQVEHYFSDFMMVLEREGEHRQIQCFSAETAGKDCPFRRWSKLRLSPALRFVGTVNFDETTRPLSDRFLDRFNLIQLSPGKLQASSGTLAPGIAIATGRMVTHSDFQSWMGNGILPGELASLLDQIRPILQRMGCPISPRVYGSICRFVSSCGSLLTPAKAFDVQISQRVLPRIRSLVTKRQLDALDQLLRFLNQNTACNFDETLPLLQEVKDASTGTDWAPEAYG